ncbi:MAG: thioredoxin family protein [Bacteroidales bacterium]
MQKIKFSFFIILTLLLGKASAQTSPEKAVEKMTQADFLTKIWNYEKDHSKWEFLGDTPVIIDFYADWCGPCRKAAPILEEVAKMYKGKVNVYKVDTQVEKVLSGNLGIKALPTFLYIPVKGEPTMAKGTPRTSEEIKNNFIKIIEEFLLKDDISKDSTSVDSTRNK